MKCNVCQSHLNDGVIYCYRCGCAKPFRDRIVPKILYQEMSETETNATAGSKNIYTLGQQLQIDDYKQPKQINPKKMTHPDTNNQNVNISKNVTNNK